MAEVKRFVVIGLGTFGAALAVRLYENECRVTGIDSSRERVEALRDQLYEAVIGDATDREVLSQLGVAQSNAVFISLGEDITRSLLATLHCRELGARQIVVKGVTREHGKLLKHLSVERVVFPETEVAIELADRMTWPNVLDFLPIDPEFSIAEMAVPDSWAGKTLSQLNLRQTTGTWVVGLKEVLTGRLHMAPDGNVKLTGDQLLVLIGREVDLHKLRDLS